MAVADLSQSAANERKAPTLEEVLADETNVPEEAARGDAIIEARTAFLVLILPDGQVGLAPDINSPVVIERGPNGDEILGACHVVIKKLTTQDTAQNAAGLTVQQMQQMGQAMQKQMQDDQIKDALKKAGGVVPKGFKQSR